jgi:hypothetical protein
MDQLPDVRLQLELLTNIIVHQEQRIAELEAENARLRARIAELERSDGDPSPPTPPSVVKPNRPQRAPGQPRKKRTHNAARKRETPTRIVEHAVDHCRHCGCTLGGGSVKRSRQVLHIPLAPVEVIEHRFIERRCPLCNAREVPGAEVLHGEVIGQHRVSAQTMAYIATWRQEGRVPFETIQAMLETFHHLHLSIGELVNICHAVAQRGQALVETIKAQLRASPVVQADETSWRQDGRNGYFWFFGNDHLCYFIRRASRSSQVPLGVLGEDFGGTLVSDFYGGYNPLLGVHQRCWAHLLRAIHDLKLLHPTDEALHAWATLVHQIYLEATQYAQKHRDQRPAQRVAAQHRYERRLMACCAPYLAAEVPQRVLCRRVERFLPELFTFVGDPRVPPDNNAAERAIRPLAVARKISGGTRSPKGSDTKGILASLFGTWQRQGLNPFTACLQMLVSP